MQIYEFYKELNNITKKDEFADFLSHRLCSGSKAYFLLANEAKSRINDESYLFYPLESLNKICCYIVLEKLPNYLDVWLLLNKYYSEFVQVAERIINYERNFEKVKNLNVLNNIQIIANSGPDLTKTCHEVAEQLNTIFDFERLSMTLLDKNEITIDFKEDENLLKTGYQSDMSVPMMFKNEIIGTLNFVSKYPFNFCDKDAELAQKAAIVLAYAIENNNILLKTQRNTDMLVDENKQLSILNNILNKFSLEYAFKPYMKLIIKEIVEELDLCGGKYYLFKEECRSIEKICKVNNEKCKKIIGLFNIKPQQVLLELQKNKIVYIKEEDIIYLPIINENEILHGFLVLYGKVGHLHKENTTFLNALKKQLSLVMVNFSLYHSIRYAAEYDTMTGLLTKKSFYRVLKKEISFAKRKTSRLVLMMADIDDFKSFNDRFGHLIGDIILKEVAVVIKDSLRKGDYIGRFGGEEFLLLLPETDMKEGEVLANRLSKRISSQIRGYNITLSIGITEFQLAKDDYISIIKRADDALYNAKGNGKNQIVIASRG